MITRQATDQQQPCPNQLSAVSAVSAAPLTHLRRSATSTTDQPNTGGPAQQRELLTVEAAATRLSIGRTTMFALIKTRAIESVKVGRLRRVPADAITDYIRHLVAEQQSAAA